MDKGSSSFSFPTVENAYKLNGKGNLKSYFIMVGIGLTVGIFGGAILFWVQTLVWALTRLSNFFLIKGALALVAFILQLLAPGYLGYFISYLVAVTGGNAKNRNSAAATVISLISGIVCFGSFLAMFFLAVEGPNSFMEYLYVAENFLIIMVASSMAGTLLKAKPLCENDNVQMLDMSLGKYPLQHEKVLIQILNSRKFKDLREVIADPQLTDDYTEITVDYCNLCRGSGFINATSHCTIIINDSNGNPKKSYSARLIYSSRLDKSEISSIFE